MKATLLQARDVAPTTARSTRRVHVGEEFFAAAFVSIVVEHVRPMAAPSPKLVQSGSTMPLAQPSPLASTSMLEAALSQLCDAPSSSAPAPTAARAPLAPPAVAAPSPTLAAADILAISSTETRISIEHPELGAIRLSLSLDGHALVLSATTESRAAQTAVSLCAPSLRVALSSQGLSLRTFDVSLTSDSDSPDPRARTRKRRGLDTEA